jgi:hypothetical protein
MCSWAQGQVTLKAVYGWGHAARLGRWTCLLATVRVPTPEPIEGVLEIEGTYGTGAVLSISQSMVVESRPRVYLLLFPLNADPTRLAVTLRDASNGKTLARQILQDPGSFTAAAQTPPVLLAADGGLVGISGDIGDATRLQSQLSQTGLMAGMLTEMTLPATAVGYEGVAALVLASPDFSQLDAEQQRAIVDWVAAGGNLVLIPPTGRIPNLLLDRLLPCDIGENQSVAAPGTEPSEINGRQLQPRPGAEAISLLNSWTAWGARFGLGRVVVLPANPASMQFSSSDQVIDFWRAIFQGMVDVPGNRPITEVSVFGNQEDIMPVGPKMSDAIGRGPRETLAIRHLLDSMDASAPRDRDWREFLLWVMGIGLLLGPLDWVVSSRVGVSPRHSVTFFGWLVLLGGSVGYAAVRWDPARREMSGISLIDQADGKVVATTDLLAVRSNKTERLPLELNPLEWWEPANQAAGNFSPNRFLDFKFQEDQEGCRPTELFLSAGEPQSLRGQTMGTGKPVIGMTLRVQNGFVVGTVTNLSDDPIQNMRIATASGNGEISDALAPGATIQVNCALNDTAIAMDGLPVDVFDITPDRTDRIDSLVKSGAICLYGQIHEPAQETLFRAVEK